MENWLIPLLFRTNQGNLSKLLLVAGYKKTAGKTVSILVGYIKDVPTAFRKNGNLMNPEVAPKKCSLRCQYTLEFRPLCTSSNIIFPCVPSKSTGKKDYSIPWINKFHVIDMIGTTRQHWRQWSIHWISELEKIFH
jgi:hypothetical protein